MALMPIFPIRLVLMLVIPVALAAIILAVVGRRGVSVFKKQGVAWGLAVLMIFAAIGIGYAKAPMAGTREPVPDYPSETIPPASANSFVRDDANVLSDEEVQTLNQRNQRLKERIGVAVGVLTCNYGRDDLYGYAVKQFERMGLGGYDMLVVLDVQGGNYWLYTGDDVAWDFSDEDCNEYLYDYMEYYFARGFYGDGALHLTEALESWYGKNYD